ncbi:hypothetical protein BACI9J_420001 [Bacillus altitudinis]|nr:hypothetical protein BACI9J_420001 [Bacillus altitudinis]
MRRARHRVPAVEPPRRHRECGGPRHGVRGLRLHRPRPWRHPAGHRPGVGAAEERRRRPDPRGVAPAVDPELDHRADRAAATGGRRTARRVAGRGRLTRPPGMHDAPPLLRRRAGRRRVWCAVAVSSWRGRRPKPGRACSARRTGPS